MSAVALMCDHIIGSFATTRTFHRFKRRAISGSPVNGKATDENLSRRRTPNSKAIQPFINCMDLSHERRKHVPSLSLRSVAWCVFDSLREGFKFFDGSKREKRIN